MKKLTAILLIICLAVSVLPTFAYAADYDDASIMKLLSMLDVMVGDENGDFHLENKVTRAEFTKVAIMSSSYRNAVPENSTTSPFGDVPYTLWSAPYITLAVDSGMISGYPDSTFRPNNTVLLEEAVTICLNLLGYTKADYGTVWPSGPMSLARSLELLDGIDKSTGDELTRRDVMYLIYNTVNTKVKGSQNELIAGINYTFLEDTVLIAGQKEDASVAKNKIVTSNGTFKIGEQLDLNLIGRRGDAFVKNGDTLVSFIPDAQVFETHSVYSVLNDDIIVYDSGSTHSINVDTSIVCYSGSKAETVASCISKLETGDVLKLAYDSDGDLDYVIHSNNTLKGPFTVTNDAWININGISSDASVIKNGKTVSLSDVEKNDVVYYSESLKLVWAYDDKVTGTYSSASPNQENPSSVIIAGNSYTLEGTSAFNKLSSNGSFKLGDTVTVLLGRNGEIADVLTDDETPLIYGYLTETGKKEFATTSGKTETSNYAKVVTADGNTLELKTVQDYKDSKNYIVSFGIKNGIANITRVFNKNTDLFGQIDADKMKFGDIPLSENIKILDLIGYNDPSQTPGFTTVFARRLDEAELSGSDILYATYSSKGEIDSLFLNDITGDACKYGIVTDVQKQGSGFNLSASYSLNLSGSSGSYNRAYITGLEEGNPVAAYMSGNSVNKIKKLRKLQQNVTSYENGYLYGDDGEKYQLGDNITVYKHTRYSSNYNLADISDVDFENGTFEYYYNGTLSKGARIRVIIWTVNNN